MVGHIGNEENAVVTVAGGKGKRHGLEDGAFVKFNEVEGIEEINHDKKKNNLYKVKVIKSNIFSVDFDATKCKLYDGEGRAT